MTKEVSLATVCDEAFGITTRRYNQMAKEGLVPAAKNGRIDWVLSSRAIITFYQKKAKNQGGSFDDARVRETTLKADLLEIELAEKKGEKTIKEGVIIFSLTYEYLPLSRSSKKEKAIEGL